ncbi:MAG TPA: hypothetical protein VF782_00630 [Allosphingosinicella sp.]|jgi:hypothetical protein
MVRRLPLILGAAAALAVLPLIGPVALAVALLRSSPDAQGPSLAAQILMLMLVLAVTALAGAAVWGLTHLALRLFRSRH